MTKYIIMDDFIDILQKASPFNMQRFKRPGIDWIARNIEGKTIYIISEKKF